MTDRMVIRHPSLETADTSAAVLSFWGGTRQGDFKPFIPRSEAPSDFAWYQRVGMGSIAQAEATSFQPEIISESVLSAPQLFFGFPTSVYDEQNLQETLADLECIDDMAKEDGLPEPDERAVANARALLPKLYTILPVRYHVSPTERRGASIDVPMKRGRTVSVECAPNDHVYCFVTIDDNSRRAKFYQVEGLPDPFIEKALRDFAGE